MQKRSLDRPATLGAVLSERFLADFYAWLDSREETNTANIEHVLYNLALSCRHSINVSIQHTLFFWYT